MRHAHWWGVALASLLACSSQKRPEPAAAAPAAVAPPFDLGAVIRQVHFAFREEGSEFRAGHRTHALSVGRDGRVTVTPYAPERGRPLSLRTVAAGAARVEPQEDGATWWSGWRPPARRSRGRPGRTSWARG